MSIFTYIDLTILALNTGLIVNNFWLLAKVRRSLNENYQLLQAIDSSLEVNRKLINQMRLITGGADQSNDQSKPVPPPPPAAA